MLRSMAVAAAAPVAALLALVGFGVLPPGPAALAATFVLAAAAGQAAWPRPDGSPAPASQNDAAEELLARLRTEGAIIDSLPDPLVVLGPDRAVTRANAAARAIFGTEMAAVLRHPSLRDAIDRTVATGMAQQADLFLPVPIEREVHATVLGLDGGRVVAVLSDRTRERALERTRADFVTNASHELRTPLASLIGFIDTLRGPAADDPPAQTRFLQIMAEQAGRMNRLIDDLLSLSRIELTEHRAPTERVDLVDLLRLTAASFEPRLAARGITLTLAVPEDLPVVAGDDDQLGQVFQNLMDNAIKYGREGGCVQVAATPAPPGMRWPPRPGLTVAVTDDGAGIAREHLPRLTERFYRVDKGRSRAVGGTGLGLAIVKHIVNRHRGQLAIDSQEGTGTTVSVWLPVVDALK